MAGMAGNGWKWLEMAGVAGNGWIWLGMAGMAGNGWKWLEMQKKRDPGSHDPKNVQVYLQYI